MSGVQSYPCAECNVCIPIGGGEGLCDYCDHIDRKFIVDLFDIAAFCPKEKDAEMFRRRRIKQKENKHDNI